MALSEIRITKLMISIVGHFQNVHYRNIRFIVGHILTTLRTVITRVKFHRTKVLIPPFESSRRDLFEFQSFEHVARNWPESVQNRSKSLQTGPNQSKSIQIKTNQPNSAQIDPNLSKSTQVCPNLSKSIQICPEFGNLGEIRCPAIQIKDSEW